MELGSPEGLPCPEVEELEEAEEEPLCNAGMTRKCEGKEGGRGKDKDDEVTQGGISMQSA